MTWRQLTQPARRRQNARASNREARNGWVCVMACVLLLAAPVVSGLADGMSCRCAHWGTHDCPHHSSHAGAGHGGGEHGGPMAADASAGDESPADDHCAHGDSTDEFESDSVHSLGPVDPAESAPQHTSAARHEGGTAMSSHSAEETQRSHEFMHSPRQRCSEDCGTFSSGPGQQELVIWADGVHSSAPVLCRHFGFSSRGRVNPVQRGPPSAA